ncbi:MAG: glycoside hydrolase family 32 protein [Microthrixaceae bacterium]|nr:glycoside hydrolase family 32 protein [Microthrixaceae bacterium]
MDDSHEPFRPGYHFSPARNWMNDPNGLVFHDGVYHLYFQHNPLGDQWGNMSWGHATSADLIRWVEQPLAIPQTLDNDGHAIEDIFSGSVVVDNYNRSGLGTAGNPPLVALYTSAYTLAHPQWPLRQAQSLAYSTDGGFTWTKYDRNPVADRGSTDFRDPKVFRYRKADTRGGYWVMVAVEAVDRQVVFARSDDLKTWEHQSVFGPANAVDGVWECPDLFELPVDGDPDNTRWVLVVNLNPGSVAGGSGGQYFVGHFDGVEFTPDPTHAGERLWLDWGRDYYAAVSYDNVPDGRRIMTGWMNDWTYALSVPTSGWRGNMTLPREVALTEVGGRIELSQRATHQIEDYRLGEQALVRSGIEVAEGTHPLSILGDMLEIDVELEMGDAQRAGVVARMSDGFTADGSGPADHEEGTLVGYDAETECVFVDRTRSGVVGFHPAFATVSAAPVSVADGVVSLRIYVDRGSVEVFAARGTRTITNLIFPDSRSQRVALFSEGGTAKIRQIAVIPLRPSR